jgi:branched-chain amino acid transport system permease protein
MAIWVVLLTAILLYLPWVISDRSLFGFHLSKHATLNMNMTQFNLTLIAIVGALGLNLLTGYTGLISLGNAAFFAVGAMVAAAVGVKWAQLPFPLVVLLAGLGGAAVGAIVGIPSLRIRGLYLLLATLALHFIMVYLFLRFQEEWFGISGIIFPPTSAFGIDLNTDLRWYYFLLAIAVIAMLLTKNILRTRRGRAFVAVRDHDIAASAVGINVARARITAFAASSFLVSAIGACYVWYLGAASVDNFTLALAIQFIAIIVIGGMGSLVGTVLGAILWQLLPNALVAFSEMAGGISPGIESTVNTWRTQITNIVFGAIILIVLVFEPSGLAGLWRKLKQAFVRWPYTT